MIPTLAILVAAGRGERMGAGRPKAFIELAGEPLLLRSCRVFAEAGVDHVVAVVPAERVGDARRLLAGVRGLHAVVAGGARRQDSVWAGLSARPADFDGVVMVHDAARPFVSPALVESVVARAASVGAALPVVPVADTIKRVEHGAVRGTIDRSLLRAAQTPQGFRLDVLIRAYEAAMRDGTELTDEAMAVERLGEPMATIDGEADNRKLTTPEDLAWAEARLRSSLPALRIGHGFDAHRLVPGRELRLGGVVVPHDRGLEGHSDGDCLVHAVCDALLGAAGLGDMGAHFPSSEDRWRGVSSLVFLREVAARLGEIGFVIVNVDATAIAQAPRLAPYVAAMREAMAAAAGVDPASLNVKLKSSDRLGAVGREEGIAAEAVALVSPATGAKEKGQR